jgi:hypothetical protein
MVEVAGVCRPPDIRRGSRRLTGTGDNSSRAPLEVLGGMGA